MRSIVAVAAACAGLPAQGFTDLTATSGLQNLGLAIAENGNGMACGDFDGDGDMDVVLPQNDGQPLLYFRNRGNGVFDDLTANAGLGTARTIHGFAVGDIDNDGDQDLYACHWNAPPLLFVNAGNGTFTEEGAARGLRHLAANYSASLGDYDRDGWLDLYLGNHGMGEANILYRNTGSGHFVDRTAASRTAGIGATFASAFFDYNEDGWPDIAIANDWGHLFGGNEIYENQGNGTFVPVGLGVAANLIMHGMSFDYADVFNDGGVDYFVTDTPVDHLFQRWDPAAARFRNDTWNLGLFGAHTGWAANFVDYDNDGWQDLHVVHSDGPNHFYRNPAAPPLPSVPWTNEAAALGVAHGFSQYTALTVDFDNDGGVDLLYRYALQANMAQPPFGSAVLRNDVPRGHWLAISLVGTASNRDGIGARVDVTATPGGMTQRQWRRSGVGFQASSDPRLHFGLGSHATVAEVTVHWPSGHVQRLEQVPADQFLIITEPSLTARAQPAVGATTQLDLHVQGDHGRPYAMVLALSDQPATVLPGGDRLPLAWDFLSDASIASGNAVLPNSSGLLDGAGRASSPLAIPGLPALRGLRVFATAVTFDQGGSTALRSVFPRAMSWTTQ